MVAAKYPVGDGDVATYLLGLRKVKRDDYATTQPRRRKNARLSCSVHTTRSQFEILIVGLIANV
jgi:hypothetical protein